MALHNLPQLLLLLATKTGTKCGNYLNKLAQQLKQRVKVAENLWNS